MQTSIQCISCGVSLTDQQIRQRVYRSNASDGSPKKGPYCGRKCSAEDRSKRSLEDAVAKVRSQAAGNELV